MFFNVVYVRFRFPFALICGNLKMLSRRLSAGELEVEFKLEAVLPLPTPPPGRPEELFAGYKYTC